MSLEVASRVLAELDEQQRAAVVAPAGPVCILAGAGTGKTRAITHRIAHRVLSGEISPGHVLAVTFTTRAAGELRGRLRELGVGGVSARTFHAAALRQLRYFAPRVLGGKAMPELLEAKARMVNQAAVRCQVTLDRPRLRDVTGEIEWAKSSMIEPDQFVASALRRDRDLPLPAEQVATIFTEYERLKRRTGVIDFEDLLRATVWAIEEHRDVAEQIRAQYRCFVVDEYQDVNPLQQRLLEAWLGGRRDLTVVGDASQTIYSFAGATSTYLLEFPRNHPQATVVRLERDYRSTPQVVGVANQIIGAATGQEARIRLTLVGQRPDGPTPRIRSFSDEPAEAAAVAAECRSLIAAGTPASALAVLFRTNAQSATYEQALAEAGVPYVVFGAEKFFDRPEIREALVLLRGAARAGELADEIGPSTLVNAVRDVLASTGFSLDSPPPGGASREKWEALAALVRLAGDFSKSYVDSAGTQPSLRTFVDELAERAAVQHAPVVEGVTLASLHAAKGLEWDAVFLVGLAEGMMPISYASTDEQLEEERRLLYVGVTRAREHLWMSWALARSPGGRAGRRPSRFLPRTAVHRTDPEVAKAPEQPGKRAKKLPTCRSCGVVLFDAVQRKVRRCSGCPPTYDEQLFEALREWRIGVAKEQELPAFCILTDATLQAVAEDKPVDEQALGAIAGIGPRKLTLYGSDVLRVVGEHTTAAPAVGE